MARQREKNYTGNAARQLKASPLNKGKLVDAINPRLAVKNTRPAVENAKKRILNAIRPGNADGSGKIPAGLRAELSGNPLRKAVRKTVQDKKKDRVR